LLLLVVFHCQMARERRAFDFEQVTRHLVDKLVRRHPHVFGKVKVKDVDEVWANWEQIKHAEKQGTRHERPSALDGIPKHLPALLRAEKLVKKARKAHLLQPSGRRPSISQIEDGKTRGRKPLGRKSASKAGIAKQLFALAQQAQHHGWSAEELLSGETKRVERAWRQRERARQPS
jgi:uncharacterized protein YabN with tetrapyrrole methylase and pyrophosphatase domain